MSRLITLEEARELIRVRYDLPTEFSANTFVTLAAVNAMINESLQAYYAILAECYGDNYFADSETFTTTADVEVSSLPDRCAKVTALWWIRGTDDIVQIRRGTTAHLKLASFDSKNWSQHLPRYRLRGVGAVQWLPKPSEEYSVRCDYVALPADLSDDEDTFDSGMGWEGFIVNDVCAKIAMREQASPAEFLAVRSDVEARIRAQAPERDEGEGLAVRDACGYGESDYERFDRLTFGDG